ncbi:MAG: hypothetical protein ACYTG5_20730, partial [Planctomycetota bacterium]
KRIKETTELGVFGGVVLLGSAISDVATQIGLVLEPALTNLFKGFAEGLNFLSTQLEKVRKSGAFDSLAKVLEKIGRETLRVFGADKISGAIEGFFSAARNAFSTAAERYLADLRSFASTARSIAQAIFGEGVATTLVDNFDSVIDALQRVQQEGIGTLARGTLIEQVGSRLSIAFISSKKAILDFGSEIAIFAATNVRKLFDSVKGVTLGLIDFGTNVARATNLLAPFATALLEIFGPIFKQAAKAIFVVGKGIVKLVTAPFRAAFDNIANFKNELGKLSPVARGALKGLFPFIGTIDTLTGTTLKGFSKALDGSAAELKDLSKELTAYGDSGKVIAKSIDDAAKRDKALKSAAESLKSSVRSSLDGLEAEKDALRANEALVQRSVQATKDLAAEQERLAELKKRALEPLPDRDAPGGDRLDRPDPRGIQDPVDKTTEAVQKLRLALVDLKDEIKLIGTITGDSIVGSITESAFASELQFNKINQLTQENRKLLNSQLADVNLFNEAQKELDTARGLRGLDTDDRFTGRTLAQQQEIENAKIAEDDKKREEKLAKIQADFDKKKLQQVKNSADARRKLRKAERATVLRGTASLFGAIASVSQSGGEKVFKVQKAFAIANAIVSTYEGAAAALKIGPAGIPLAAAIVLSGLARVRQIKATQPGGGGGLSPGGGSAPTAPPPAEPAVPELPVPEVEQEGGGRRDLQVVIQGNVFGDEEFVRERIAPVIRESIDDNEDFGLRVDVTRA